MKSRQFRVRRFLWMTGILPMILVAAALLRGRGPDTALSGSFTWALVTAAIFTGWRYHQANPARKGVACALCGDTVDSTGENTP
jgi:hypothetical protein